LREDNQQLRCKTSFVFSLKGKVEHRKVISQKAMTTFTGIEFRFQLTLVVLLQLLTKMLLRLKSK
jgi:hypothetical protein